MATVWLQGVGVGQQFMGGWGSSCMHTSACTCTDGMLTFKFAPQAQHLSILFLSPPSPAIAQAHKAADAESSKGGEAEMVNGVGWALGPGGFWGGVLGRVLGD